MMNRDMSSFSSRFMPAIGSSRRRRSGSIARARPSSTRFCRPYGKRATGTFRIASISRKSTISSTRCPMLDLLRQRRAVAQHLPQKAPAHLQCAASHNIVERAHSLEQGDVLKSARDAAAGRFEGLHPGTGPSLEGDGAMIGMIEAVDDVEHRGFAGTVRSDDGANFALHDIE